jgi:hypothetical protein
MSHLNPDRPPLQRSCHTAKQALHHRKHAQDSRNDLLDESRMDSSTFQTSRSLKEFSYFDWSKVKLFKERYKASEQANVSVFHRNDLSLIRSPAVRSQATRPGASNFEILNSRENDLPQVVTIRFT